MHNAFMPSTTSGERLRRARKAAGFEKAADAARALGIAYATYAGHENGSRGYNGEIDRYAQFFAVRGEWLRTGKGEMKPGKKPLVLQLYDELAPELQAEAIRYLKYLRSA